ncbi:actin-like protein arp6, variant [Blastomyces gilchristii SLH14081]|uniref:Actin-like protein arp6 n=1 Tax=Blastomyces gilchristii (strain SLH14081) TaxID=559298 RepID=A0A179V1I1_BLAGS|nr:actin-like protein arp6 [Blastomyces gilchristii SLH14081]XP_031581321.1 actin-like protein arp6, variant [Blastomyces gilchristii SLH14081]OAT14205.1 actin-like protein arp6 [Blastomyces gilchristii SLH14081]OAT14206.1 actin-like protein arp6, variant [Blastomyces gilchristii SLH14081]
MGAAKPSRAAKRAPSPPPLPSKTFIIDNGAYTMKAGYAPDQPSAEPPLNSCLVIPNALARTRDKRVYIGAQLSTHISDWNEATFRRPVEKGYVVSWEAEKEIWDHTFFDDGTARKPELRCADPENTTLIFTEAPNAMAALQKNADEIIMEEWGFGGYLRCIGPTLNAWNELHALFGDPVTSDPNSSIFPVECLLVIDSGYSHTTVTPVYKGYPLQRGIRRLEIGGKYLTNFLKELVSIRQYNMLDETHIINEVKEAACFVSNDFAADIERTWKGNRKRKADDHETGAGEGIVVDYVLPDPNAHKKGFVRPHESLTAAKKKKELLSGASGTMAEDVLVLGNERFTVPEILFNPGDIGMKQMGIPEIVTQSLSVLPTGLHPAFWANIMVVGGNSLIPGFMERLETELRKLASAECVVRVKRPDDAIRSTWLGAARFASNREALKEVAITRQQYQEYGSAWAGRRFSGT